MAKRYTFRFETLLRLRQQREDEQKRVVGARLREIESVRHRRASLERQVIQQVDAVRDSLLEGRMDMDQMRWGRHWLGRLRRGVLEAGAEISAHRAVLAQERVELAKARKETKVLERLKEKRRETFVAEAARAEQIQLDEMNVTRFAHAAMGEHAAIAEGRSDDS